MKSEKVCYQIEVISKIIDITFYVYIVCVALFALWSWVFDCEFDSIFWKIGLGSFITILVIEFIYEKIIKPKYSGSSKPGDA